MTEINKAEPRPLYVRRNVLNAADIVEWAKGQGFETTVPAEEMHATITFSRSPVDWMKMGQAWSGEDGKLTVPAGGARMMDRFGPAGDAAVLLFVASELSWRHEEMVRAGASWDHFEYQPHITISWKAAGVDLDKVTPYAGKILFGPEVFEPLKDDWKDGLVEKSEVRVCKVDTALGIVFGWAIVCKIDGEDYYDLNVDRAGEHAGKRVPEHISEDAMLKATVDFMSGPRSGNEMHAGPDKGMFLCAWPMTTEIAKSMGITTTKTGLMVAYKPPADVLSKFADGTYTGFSIEGARLSSEEIV